MISSQDSVPPKNHRFARHPQQNEKRIHRPACVTFSRFLTRPRDGADSDSPTLSPSLCPLSLKSCFAQQMSGQMAGAGKAPGTDGGTITKEAAPLLRPLRKLASGAANYKSGRTADSEFLSDLAVRPSASVACPVTLAPLRCE